MMGSNIVLLALLMGLELSSAFVPRSMTDVRVPSSTSTSRVFAMDPSFIQDMSHQFQHHASDFVASTSTLLSDVDVAMDAASVPMDAAAAASDGNGWFGFLTGPIEGLLQIIHNSLMNVGMSENSWGLTICLMTILIKVATLPLTKTQLESTTKMQALQPVVKEVQSKYQSNPEVMNQKISELYKANDMNPLAGCLPAFAQIPIFIGLYRAVLTLAKEDRLNEPFLFLPNLEGPTYGADPAHGSDWIMKGWVDGVPSLGWPETTTFLILPVLLVLSQFASMELMTPKDQPQQNNAVLKLLPLMIGYFSLNVPAALCIYWLTNNIVTTSITLFVRSQISTEAPIIPGASGAVIDAPASPSTIFTPPPPKPSGFGPATIEVDADEVKTITSKAVVDAEILDADSDGAEKKVTPSSSKSKKRGKKKRKGKK